MALLPKFITKFFVSPNAEMKISKAGVDLIKRFEEVRLKAYPDQEGNWTIGWGHIKGVYKGMKIDLPTANKFLLEDMAEAEAGVRSYINVKLNQNQYDSLVSWTFNCGIGALKSSTLRKRLNKGEYEAVPSEMARWNKVFDPVKKQYVVSNGLARRRKIEGDFFMRIQNG